MHTVCFFWFVTLHDDIAQPPGMQNTSAMAHFVDNKWAFYNFLSLGLFDKNLTSAIGEEALDKTGEKGHYFSFFMEHSFFKWLYYLNGLNKKCQVGPKLKLIKNSFKKNKKRSIFWCKKSHQDCKELAPLTRFGSRIDSQLKKLTQDIDNILEFKKSQKLLQNTFHLRPIWYL